MSRLVLGLAGVCAGLLVVSAFVGTAGLSAVETFGGLMGRGDVAAVIVWEIRLPRGIAALLVGASLGLAGAAMQGLLRNPLAGPGVLGVSAFAALGAVVAIFFGVAAWSALVVPVAAIGGALGAVGVLMVAIGRGADTVKVILVGIGLSALAGALMSLALNLAPNPYSLSDMVNWMLGSVANRSWVDVGLAAPFWLAGAALILVAGPGLRALSLGEETALTLGADPARVRWLVILGTGLLTGASVAVAGTIGFVGMVAPHLVRRLVRNDPARLLVPSALAAGAILLAADVLVRIIPFQQELHLGVAAALFGAPVFIWIAGRLSGERA